MFFLALRDVGKAGNALNVPVSVVICAHDEEQNLKELVPMLLAQNHPEFEIIVVNDRSNDGTYDWLLAETKKHERLKMVHVNFKPEHVNGKKFALTLGIKAARYDWVLLTDADCRPASNEWIHQMAGTFTEKNSLVLGYPPYHRAGYSITAPRNASAPTLRGRGTLPASPYAFSPRIMPRSSATWPRCWLSSTRRCPTIHFPVTTPPRA